MPSIPADKAKYRRLRHQGIGHKQALAMSATGASVDFGAASEPSLLALVSMGQATAAEVVSPWFSHLNKDAGRYLVPRMSFNFVTRLPVETRLFHAELKWFGELPEFPSDHMAFYIDQWGASSKRPAASADLRLLRMDTGAFFTANLSPDTRRAQTVAGSLYLQDTAMADSISLRNGWVTTGGDMTAAGVTFDADKALLLAADVTYSVSLVVSVEPDWWGA